MHRFLLFSFLVIPWQQSMADPPTASHSQPWYPPVCPSTCACSLRIISSIDDDSLNQNWTRTVDCSSRNLHRIPRDLPADTQALLLQHNSITMHVGLSQMPQLRILNLSHNAIQGCYGRLLLPQLRHLDMGYNSISRVAHGDNDFFAPLANLRTLILTGNAIGDLDYYAFALPGLVRLDLNENRLVTFSAQLLANLPALKNVDLSGNLLRRFQPMSVHTKKAIYLNVLNLSRNSLEELVVGNMTVETLNLSGNAFEVLDWRSFGGFDTEFLDISRMGDLWAVRESAFRDVRSVKVIDLSRNVELEYLETGSFQDLPHLNALNFDETSLMELPKDLVSSNISFTHRNVPLHCDLNLDYFLTFKSGTCSFQNQSISTLDLPPLLLTPQFRQVPPTILPTFPRRLQTELGSILELQCQTTGNTSTQISWFRYDSRRNREYPLPSQSGLLKAGPLFRVDSGLLVCRAINDYGSVNRSVKVTVVYAPVVLIPLSVTQQYITFAWNNSDSSIASQFRITYFEFTGWQNWTLVRMIFMEHLVRTYTISNLKADTMYKLCISLNKSGVLDELDCKNITTKPLEVSGRGFQAAHEVLIVIGCISILLFVIFMSTCVYRFYQEKQQDAMTESLSRILLSDSSCMNSEATTPTTYFNPGVDPLTPTTDLDVRAAFLPADHPYRNAPYGFARRPYDLPLSEHFQMESTPF